MLEDGLGPKHHASASLEVEALGVDLAVVSLRVDHREAGAILVIPAVDEGVGLAAVLEEFVEGRVVEVLGESLGLDGGHVGAALLDEAVLEVALAGAKEGREDARSGEAALAIRDEFGRAKSLVLEAEEVRPVHDPGFEFILAMADDPPPLDGEEFRMEGLGIKNGLVCLETVWTCREAHQRRPRRWPGRAKCVLGPPKQAQARFGIPSSRAHGTGSLPSFNGSSLTASGLPWLATKT